MTHPDCKNVLVTAWNDSGAGRFMRLMDGADQIFAFPFELLLGAESKIGIQNEQNLVSGKYRWNVFRNEQKINESIKQQSLTHQVLDPSESELNDWLAARKFNTLSQYKGRARLLIDNLANKALKQRYLLHTNAVLDYIESMKSIFTENDTVINLIHSPCSALDWQSRQFFHIFNQIIVIVIDPRWGFGNMHTRNQISPHRYLERWLRVNEASFQLKQKHPERVLLLCSSTDINQQNENIALAHSFLGINTINPTTRTPSLLGESIGDLGFPFGGIVDWSVPSYQASVSKANEALARSDNKTATLLNQCASLYTLLET